MNIGIMICPRRDWNSVSWRCHCSNIKQNHPDIFEHILKKNTSVNRIGAIHTYLQVVHILQGKRTLNCNEVGYVWWKEMGTFKRRIYSSVDVSKDLVEEVAFNSSQEWSCFSQANRELGKNVPGSQNNRSFGLRQDFPNAMCMGWKKEYKKKKNGPR